ncbi:hypothetical protein T261_5589 [Streptomyces lydicus]|nr:hypothetical protein T261_5589 [Streptomyces lydicus]
MVSQRELPAHLADDLHDEEPDGSSLESVGDERYLERAWALADGTQLTEAAVVDVFLDDDGEVERIEGSAVQRQEEATDGTLATHQRPRLLSGIRDVQRCDADGRWALGGTGGLFVMDVLNPAELQGGTSPWRTPLVPVLHSAIWPMPDALLSADRPDLGWCESCFGEGVVRRLPARDIPDGVSDSRTRRFLTEVGFPCLDDGELRFLTTVALDEVGFMTNDRPDVAASGYRLGSWLGEEVVLDGATGRVLLSTATGTELLGSSMRQFTILVCLCRLLRDSRMTTVSEHRDARRSIKAWAQEVDPEATACSSWQGALNGDLDDMW